MPVVSALLLIAPADPSIEYAQPPPLFKYQDKAEEEAAADPAAFPEVVSEPKT